MPEDRSRDLGRVSCSLRGRVEAGSFQTCRLKYTAGFAGIDDTGSLKIVMRYATDCGQPQFDDPGAANYTTAVASNGARLLLRYDVKDNVRPWGKTIYIKVLQGYLRRGDRITLTLGDTSGGSPGWRMQTFLEDSFELRVLVDRYATYCYERMPDSPTMRIVAGEPVRLVAVAPSLVEPGEKFVVRSKLEDQWGNPVGRPKSQKHAAFKDLGTYTVAVVDKASRLAAETNPIVVRSSDEYRRYWADLHGQSEETIGTNTIDDYFSFARDYGFVDACAHQGNDFQITDAFWKKIEATTSHFYEPGRFVTFPGWEWSGNTALGGDRNVLFKHEGGIITRSSRALVAPQESTEPCAETVENLFERMAEGNGHVMLVPHVGGRYADLARHSESLEPVVEVHSAWGTFEWMLDDAFRRGYRIGIVANSDGHKGRPGASYPGASTFGSYGGLTCILAERLDRESVWEAYQQRRVYATTGARIFLDVTAEGAQQGSILYAERGALPTLSITAHGTAPIERLEIRNAMRVLKTVRTYSTADLAPRLKVLWQGATVRGRGRQVIWDGGLRVAGNRIDDFQTINFHNLEKSCRQTSATALHWESITTGGVAGVVCDLKSPTAGRLEVDTAQKNFAVKISSLGTKGRSYELGDVGKKISAYRLPPAAGSRELAVEFTPDWKDLKKGDNPLYVCLVQEDGQLAWSSPIYYVRR